MPTPQHYQEEPTLPPSKWRLNAFLFFLTLLTTFSAGASQRTEFLMEHLKSSSISPDWVNLFPLLLFGLASPLEVFSAGLPYAATILTILLFHEFGHYLYARKHGVDASLPYFIPMPLMFIGTMGAVIRMRGKIPDRNALLDIGAGGPLGGLIVAIPMMIVGVSLSKVEPLPQQYMQEGNSLLYMFIKFMWHGHIPAGYDVFIHPIAFAAWFGFFMTALNLLPIGQLDGGHITFAWLPKVHPILSRVFHTLLFASPLFLYFIVGFDGLNWFFFALVIRVLMGEFGPRHPPVESDAPLSPFRKFIAALSMTFFILLLPLVPLRDIDNTSKTASQPSSQASSQPTSHNAQR